MKKKNRLLGIGLWLAFFFVFALGQQAWAATNTWIGAATGNWNTAGNWSDGVPTADDDVIIPTGIAVTIDEVGATDAVARTITINGTGSLVTAANTIVLNVAQTAIGGIYINSTSAAAFNASAGGTIAIGNTTYRGDFYNNSTGTVNLGTGAVDLTIYGDFVNLLTDGTITTDATTILKLGGSVNVSLPDDIANFDDLTIDKAGASVTINKTLTIAGNLTITNGTMVVDAYNLTVTGTTGIALGATLNANSNSSDAHTRIFTGVITLNGTLNAAGPNITNTFTAALSIPATGILNINFATSAFTTTVDGAALGATINALGAKLTFTGIVTFTNLTLNTNNNTDLTTGAAQTAAGDEIPALALKNLTFGAAANINGNLTVYGNYTSGAFTITLNGTVLTVYGTFDAAGGTHDAAAANSGLILYGPITDWGQYANGANLDLTVDGIGATPTPIDASLTALHSLTMNRLAGNVEFGVGVTIGTTLTINAGTVTEFTGGAFVVNGATTIAANGKLVTNGATTSTFNGAFSGAGIVDADHADDELIFTAGNFNFTGEMITATTTILTFSTVATIATLPSSITQLEELRMLGALAHKITLSNDLTLDVQLAAANFANAAGTLYVNGYKLTCTGGVAAAAATKLDLTNGSIIRFGAAAALTGMTTIVTDETSNVESVDAITGLPTAITKLNNITLVTAGQITLTANLAVYGNISIGTGCTLDKATFDLTVYGDVSNFGTMTLTGAGGTLKLHGAIIGTGTYTTNATNTQIEIAGTSGQLQLPVELILVNDLTLNRAAGMKLNANLTVGAAATLGVLTITKGDLDLNGHIIDLACTAGGTMLVEQAGYKVINTGAMDATTPLGCIQTGALSQANAIASGIGIVNMTVGGNVVVRRYPACVPITGVGLSTNRIYQINTTAPTVLTLQFDNTELNSQASMLRLYTSTSLAFTIPVDQTLTDLSNKTINENTPVGKGNVAYSSFKTAANASDFYALAGVPGSGGVLKTYVGIEGGNWGEPANWNPSGVPTKVDQVVIGPYTVYLNSNGSIYECSVLQLNHANATLLPTDNTINGDNVSLRVMGNITLTVGASIEGANGFGRLNLMIGDGVTTGVSSKLTPAVDYVPNNGIWVNNLTINSADVTTTSNRIRVSGNMTLQSNCSVILSSVEFWGGYASNQVITVPNSSLLTLGTVRLDNTANVSTDYSFTMTDAFSIKSGSSFIANGGNALFNTPVANEGDPWNVENGGTLKLNDVELNSSAGAQTFAPLGTAYIQGNFYQYGTDAYEPTSGLVIFSNISQKEIVNTATAADLVFYDLQVATGSEVITSNSWQVASEIDVKDNASLIAENGTIDFVNAAPAEKWIKNASTHTLEFNNLTLSAGTIYTNDSWTIKGDLTSAGGNLQADNGVITFSNNQLKTINNAALGTFQFFKLLVADGSRLTTPATAAHGDFRIANNNINQTGAGIEVQGTGQFYVGNIATETVFGTSAGVTPGHPKTITKSSSGRLDFGTIIIAPQTANEVTTASDFKITGTGSAFINADAGAYFEATAGTITFTGAAPQITNVTPAVAKFYNIQTEGATALTFPNADGQDVRIRGNLILNGTSTIAASAHIDCKVIFDGTEQQIIGGSTSSPTPVTFNDLIIEKTNGSEVLMQLNVVAGSAATHELTLSSGILNLGAKTLTVGAGIITRIDGAINGGTGTYVINTNHQTPKLEDIYFTVNGTPTLYGLKVDAAHTTANDLTVNGTLNLNAADLTIGSGTSASNPVKLMLNGNLTRVSAEIDGDDALSRFVLQGTGTVANGLSNLYFNGGTATTAQLEIARQETLGGNINIATGSFLRINSGINDFNLGSYKLEFNGTAKIIMLSGGILAGTNSSVVLPAGITEIPASMFRNNECYNLTIAADMTLRGDLKINKLLSGLFDITTNENILTVAYGASIPAFGASANVFGKVRRTVTNTATVFPIGDAGGTNYYPLTLQFANAISSQNVLVYTKKTNPVYGRGGNPNNAALVEWVIVPEGTEQNDSMKASFQWNTALDGVTTPTANASFPAKWNGTNWVDYRNNLMSFSVPTPRILTMNPYPIKSANDLNGSWAIFNASANTDVAKDKAIATNKNKLVITKINPIPVALANVFKVTIELQDSNNQPITTAVPFEFKLVKLQGDGVFADYVGVIPAGQSYTTVSGLVITTTAGANHQLRVDTTGSSDNWQPGVSELFTVLPALPTGQSHSLVFSNIKTTAMTIDWTSGTGAKDLVIIKADTLLAEDEFPIDGTFYTPNTIMGAGSSLGYASVIFNGVGTSVDVTGLSPNTTYYVYVFSYDGAANYERYRTTAAAANPKSQVTIGSFDDDVTLGTNNTRASSKGIGTNTIMRGTVKNINDEDWFNFTLTNSAPNVRVKLYNLIQNYNVELYNQSGERIRRSILPGDYSDSFIVNELSAGTYTVKIYGVSGAFDASNPYSLLISTKSNEIFSVTP